MKHCTLRHSILRNKMLLALWQLFSTAHLKMARLSVGLEFLRTSLIMLCSLALNQFVNSDALDWGCSFKVLYNFNKLRAGVHLVYCFSALYLGMPAITTLTEDMCEHQPTILIAYLTCAPILSPNIMFTLSVTIIRRRYYPSYVSLFITVTVL